MNILVKVNHKIIIWSLYFLFAFLPFSSWVVSITANQWLSLIRDILIIIFILFVLINKKYKLNYLSFLLILFVVYCLLSIFWKEASLLQWFKGFRFSFGPLILFLGIINFPFEKKIKNNILKIVFITGLIICIIGVLELVGIKIPLSLSGDGSGVITALHNVGTLNIIRIQSILAGPNALGLYLLALLSLGLGVWWNKLYWFNAIILALIVFTFSRSTWIGVIVILVFALYYYLKLKTKSSWIVLTFVTILILISGFVLTRYEQTSQFFTHNDSSKLRWEQYERIWDSKFEIGLLGRGSGSAGPASQYRLDNGENHWTENIYLDLFEDYGFVGIILYLAILASVGNSILKMQKETGSTERSALYIYFAFLITGIFINYYTGQVGIFIHWLILGLAFNKKQHNISV